MIDKMLQKLAKYIDTYLNKKRGKVDPEKWEVHIERASNGYILKQSTFGIEGVEGVSVHENKKEIHGELHAFLNVCWELVEYFGLHGSKYDKERIRMTLKPGECWSGEDGIQDDEESLSSLDE